MKKISSSELQSVKNVSEEFSNFQHPVWEIILEACQNQGLGQQILSKSPLPGGYKKQAFKITTDKGDLFVKVNKRLETYSRFEQERESLKLINETVPGFAPNCLVIGKLLDQGAFLITYYLPLEQSTSILDEISLANKLAQLHQNRSSNGKFGFDYGFSKKPNDWESNWEIFFKENRWRPLWKRVVEKYSQDEELKERGQIIFDKVISNLLGGLKVEPTLLHGDLWNGNWGINSETKEPIIFDPQSYYGHNEMELGIMTMFGSKIGEEFFNEYHKYHPRQEPNFDERQKLYKLYHYLNHYYLLGSERNNCLETMKELCQNLEKEKKSFIDNDNLEIKQELQVEIPPKVN